MNIFNSFRLSWDPYHIETSSLIRRANNIGTSIMKELRYSIAKAYFLSFRSLLSWDIFINQCFQHKENSRWANLSTGFYIIGTLVVNDLSNNRTFEC